MGKRKRRVYIDAGRLPVLVILLSVIFAAGSLWLGDMHVRAADDVSGLSAKTEDGAIVLSWNNPKMGYGRTVALSIKTDGAGTLLALPSHITSYRFRNGAQGERYTFSVQVKEKDGTISNGATAQAMFLDFDKLPDLPLLSIETPNGKEPVCELDEEKPEGCVGVGITGNEYVRGSLTLSRKGQEAVHTQMKFRVRGNTPSRLKTPYKIKLDSAMDLLSRDDAVYAGRDWALLSYGTDLKFPVSMFVSALCRFEWHPAYEFVNVIVNGDYRGCYLLTETVSRGAGRVGISKSGFLMENDTYWWNTGGTYMKTDKLQQEKHKEMGFTFKYPSDADETFLERVRQYMNAFETALWSGDLSWQDYIDTDSFVGWLMFQDLLASWDGSGTNMYLVKEEFDENAPMQTKLKMGPAWDTESGYMEQWRYRWAAIHTSNIMYFKQLLTYDEFREAYRRRWEAAAQTVSPGVDGFLSVLTQERGEALQASWDLDAKRWGVQTEPFDAQAEFFSDWFSSRVRWMDGAVDRLSAEK